MKNLITLFLLILPLILFSQDEVDFSDGYNKADSSTFITQSVLNDSTAAVRADFPSGGGGGGGCVHAFDQQNFVFNTTFFNFSDHDSARECYTYFRLDSGNSDTQPNVVNIDEADSWQNGDIIIIQQFGLGTVNFGFRFVGINATNIIHIDGTNGSSGDLGGEPTYRETASDSNQTIKFVRSNDKWLQF